MKSWKPKRRVLIKLFLIIAISIGLLSKFNNSWERSILIGLGAGLFFTSLTVLQSWVNEKVRGNMLNKFKKNSTFNKLNFQIINDYKIIGKVNDYDIELIPEVEGEIETYFKLIIDLSNKPSLCNSSNIKNALGKEKFELNGNILTVTNWKPKLWTYSKFHRLINKIKDLLNKLEGKRTTTQNKRH